MSSPRQTALFTLFLLLAGVCASFAAKAAEDEAISPPPMPQPVRASIYQGQSVEIPLKVIGRTSPPLHFFIRSQPSHGTLSNLHIVGPDAAEITYTPTDAEGSVEDSFTFAAQALGTPVSAPGRVDITITEEPAALAFQHELDFGPVYLGESSERDFVLQNTGGGMLTGHVSVPAPWSVVGDGNYGIGRHGQAVIRLHFNPTEARKFLSSIDFSGNVTETVALEGVGVQPFAIASGALEFRAGSGEAIRKAVLTIRNDTNTPRTVQLALPGEITGPAATAIPAGGSVNIPLQTSATFTGAETGQVKLVSGAYVRDIPFTVFTPPPEIAVTSGDRIDFGNVLPGRQYERKITVLNKSSVPVQLHAEYPPEIEISPDPNGESLQPGVTTSFEVILESGTARDWQGKLSVSAAGGGASSISLSSKSASEPALPATVQAVKLTPPDPGILMDEGKPPGGYSHSPPVSNIKISASGPHFLELAWPKVPDAARYKVEQRMLTVSPDGRPAIKWQPVTLIKYREENGNVIVRFDRLPSGRSWVIRISSIDRSGALSAPSKSIRIIVPARRAWHIPVWAGVLAVAGAGYWLWRRRSISESRADADRIARLGKS